MRMSLEDGKTHHSQEFVEIIEGKYVHSPKSNLMIQTNLNQIPHDILQKNRQKKLKFYMTSQKTEYAHPIMGNNNNK